MPLTIFTADRFADHLTPPGHPERVERFEVMQLIVSEFRRRGGAVVEPRRVTDAELARVHDPDYVTLIKETAGRATQLDPDTYTSPLTYDAATLAAGAVVDAVDHVLDAGTGARALAVVRPPGHHAERNRAMGFCFFNSIAVGAAHARARGLARVAVVDYDVHHGNGTQWAFYADPRVLYVSTHQFPFYPGTGAVDETGSGAGKGFTLNIPLAAGAGDEEYDRAYATIVQPALEAFAPDVLLISAGFDIWINDPLAGMRVTRGGITRILTRLRDAAEATCGSRVMLVTEGGYDLPGLTAGVEAVFEVFGAR